MIHGLADSTRLPEPVPSEEPRRPTGFIANPSSTRRQSHAASLGRRLPGTMSVAAGDMTVRLIDKGDNTAGIGIRVELPEGRTLSDEEKDIVRKHVRGEDGEQTGFAWKQDVGMWHKDIVRPGEHADAIPRTRPVAIRLDAESRVERLAESLRHHQADPVGFAEMVRQRREQAAQGQSIPD